MSAAWSLLAFSALLPVLQCLQWTGTLHDGGTVYACINDDASLSWEATLGSGETIVDMKWLYNAGSQQLIAVYTAGNFLPTPTYSSRVQHVPQTGLVLQHVTASDSGNYTVEVNVRSSAGVHTTYTSTVYLNVVTEDTATTAATVHVLQESIPAYDSNTGQYHIRLACTGLSPDITPSSVIWETPSGPSLPGTNPVNGVFTLMLPNPVAGGNYTCRINPNSPGAACLPPNTPKLDGDTLHVDDVRARLSLLEVQQRVLMAENTYLKDENARLRDRVSFDARLSGNRKLHDGDVLKLDRVTDNEGDNYDPATGVFTAPYDGTYFFEATTSSSAYDNTAPTMFAKLEMVADDNVVSTLYTRSTEFHAMGSCQALLHLTQGQRVWLRSRGEGDFADFLTSFTGFMIHRDDTN